MHVSIQTPNTSYKKHSSVAEPPACRTHLCWRAYFVISLMRMRRMCVHMCEILCTHAHEILMPFIT